MLNCFTKSLPNCCAKWIFGIIVRKIAAPNQYLRSICAKNVRQILFESLFCAEDLSEFLHSKNIRETLVHSSLAQASTSQIGTFPCLSSKCKTCDFIDSTNIVSAPKSEFHIKHHFMCASSHLIYCISCSRCGMLYIGETGRCLRTRFGEHWRAVIGNDANQPVARHFNDGNHSVSDMLIRALCPISGSNDSRK